MSNGSKKVYHLEHQIRITRNTETVKKEPTSHDKGTENNLMVNTKDTVERNIKAEEQYMEHFRHHELIQQQITQKEKKNIKLAAKVPFTRTSHQPGGVTFCAILRVVVVV